MVDEMKKLEQEEKEAIDVIKSLFECRKDALKEKYKGCSHEWGSLEYVPEDKLVPRYISVRHGVAYFPKLVGMNTEKKDRWAKQCKKCGKVKYTYKQ